MTQWISVEDYLPFFDKIVLVSVSGKNPYVSPARLNRKLESVDGVKLYWQSQGADDSYDEIENVSWWMPLPEPATIPEK